MERASALRLAACGILGLGAALIMAALLLGTYTVGKVSKIPLDIDARLISTGKGAVLNMEKLNPPEPPEPPPGQQRAPRPPSVFKVDPDKDVEQQQQITTESGPEGQNNDDFVTLQVGTTFRRTLERTAEVQGDAGLLLAMIDTVTVNRKTGMAADTDGPNGWLAKPRDFRGTDKPVPEPLQHTGLTYRFPVNVDKDTSYEVFDPIAQKSFPAAYVDDADVLGMTTYHYVQGIGMNEKGELLPPDNPRDLTTYKQEKYSSLLPPDPKDPNNKKRADAIITARASEWDLPPEPPHPGEPPGDPLVTMVRFYAAYHDFWVDPVSGTIVKQRDQAAHYFVKCKDPDCNEYDAPAQQTGGQLPADAKVLVKYDIQSTQSTVEAQVSSARDQRDQIALWGRILPITIGALGVIALVGGALLGVFGARAETALIDPGLDQRDLDFFPRGPAGEPVPGAEAETEKLPTQRSLQRPIQAEPPPEQPPP